MATRTPSSTPGRYRRGLNRINSSGHRVALQLFMVIVVAHWAEHIVQAIQVYVLDWPIPEARGVLGIPFPWLVTSEWMHYGYALIMLIGLFMLLPGFTGRSRTWWKISTGIQVWHHFEHLLLLLQALVGRNLGGGDAPMSILQMVIPRVELHLFYNAIVFAPMVVAMYLHTRPNKAERESATCGCGDRSEALTR
ncbi:hypothetical protein [Nocardiopsis ansamitocini]|uniref:Uncharacterized protein n=1 Tax=Nocardiopsis ansamitocini TaxID=1670832 RepID=A0A9W6UJG2_9ACTN|nr:hypothetical protein [Nocardiopsis ansamitocini]GLU48692.1 hypothetical protein Nans01_30430 [Nocardiopsis ansamitocini]